MTSHDVIDESPTQRLFVQKMVSKYSFDLCSDIRVLDHFDTTSMQHALKNFSKSHKNIPGLNFSLGREKRTDCPSKNVRTGPIIRADADKVLKSSFPTVGQIFGGDFHTGRSVTDPVSETDYRSVFSWS